MNFRSVASSSASLNTWKGPGSKVSSVSELGIGGTGRRRTRCTRDARGGNAWEFRLWRIIKRINVFRDNLGDEGDQRKKTSKTKGLAVRHLAWRLIMRNPVPSIMYEIIITGSTCVELPVPARTPGTNAGTNNCAARLCVWELERLFDTLNVVGQHARLAFGNAHK